MKRKLHHLSPKRICIPKSYGGLNIIDAIMWNKASMCGLIPKLIKNEDSTWADGQRKNHFKVKHFWTMPLLVYAS